MALPSFKSLTQENIRVKVVDIGANPIDSEPPYARLLKAGDADVVGFEPNRNALAQLHRMKGANETYLPYALGDGATHTLHMCAAPGMTSLLTPNPQVLNLFHGFPNWSKVVSTEMVETARLDDIAETADVDLIKIDVQGAELMVLRNGIERLRTTLVIQTEIEFLPMYVDQPLFADVDTFLRGQGFVLHRFYPIVSRVIAPLLVGNNIYAGLSQTVWGDAIFVRDFTRLDLIESDQLLRMATLLHDCYESIDLVHFLLLEHDKRSGKALAGTYLQKLKTTTDVQEQRA
jgi:FkbM family methyltransferase